MRYPNLAKTMAAMLLFALLVAACGPAPTDVPTLLPTDPPVTEPPVVTEPPAATAGVPVTGAATVNVAEVGTFGQALVDAEGRSLYLFTNDTQNSGASSCTGECLVNWPPLFTGGAPVAGEGVDAAMLSTIALPDGTMQVTYNGWPLYYYIDDAAAGDASGQGVGGVWFLVSPTGEMIEQ